MMKKLTKVLTAALLAVSLMVCTVYAKEIGIIDTDAAVRSADETLEFTLIDDEAIALAEAAGTSTNCASAAQAAAGLINQQRAAAGLGGLVWNNGLAQAAAVRAQECRTSFSHTRPDGSDWWTVNSELMYGENLAEYYYNANDVVAGWMASPAHKANILGAFSIVGIAVYQDEAGKWYWALEFG